jgi:hypothetical protein
MKLWLLRPIRRADGRWPEPWEPWYDKVFGFVVRATDETQARLMASEKAGEEAFSSDEAEDEAKINPWLEPTLSRCKELTSEGEPGIVIRDYSKA